MSKKMLVRFDPKKPEKKSSDFLGVTRDESGLIGLVSLKNGKPAEYGLVVFTGREVTPNDVFAKLVDSGMKIESVEQTLSDLGVFVEAVSSFNIGNVLKVKAEEESRLAFGLEKTNLKAGPAKSKKLP